VSSQFRYSIASEDGLATYRQCVLTLFEIN
jgi:hypothetical protein